MMKKSRRITKSALLFCFAMASPAQTLTVLFSFSGSDGYQPVAPLIQGIDGNLYGTTSLGGGAGNGTLFRITPGGTLSTLHNFCSSAKCADGSRPVAGLVQAADGNLYGTTQYGGVNIALGDGTVFRITPGGTLTTLYKFCSLANCADGAYPAAGLVRGRDGNFYGTTANTVFKMTPQGDLSTLYAFTDPLAVWPLGLVQGRDGNFYGTTIMGGKYHAGTVFVITPRGKLATLHNFRNTDGWKPEGGLVQGADGGFYGTTYFGGGKNYGTVFKITPHGMLTTLYSFCAESTCIDGVLPEAGLVEGGDGMFYGTTSGAGAHDHGTVFRITPDGTLTTLYAFDVYNGDGPQAALLKAADGRLYGTTALGGSAGFSEACGA
ncbi:MAG TPA: choice-of-anchor tandem repeat GloVer-containing protein, partial [Bryobacteraceae bacterium]|nr:choice-of-anchor tandem repeat GloVer-containing protein [Bryobacteraceae bacterium]